jgi:hypothetical protein
MEGVVIRKILYAGRGTKKDNRTQIGEWWEIRGNFLGHGRQAAIVECPSHGKDEFSFEPC